MATIKAATYSDEKQVPGGTNDETMPKTVFVAGLGMVGIGESYFYYDTLRIKPCDSVH